MLKLMPENTVCISVPPSPLLGGIIIAICEGLTEFDEFNLCLNIDEDLKAQIRSIGPVIEFAKSIIGVKSIRIFCGSEVLKTYGICPASTHIHKNINRNINSPQRLLYFLKSGRSIIFPRVSNNYLDMAKIKIGISGSYIVIHANLGESLGTYRNLRQKFESKGYLSDWQSGIEKIAILFPKVAIALIGADAIKFAPFSQKNVFNLELLGISLAEQMSLIPDANYFLGMSSGPSALAILSQTPYTIFKHPKHHAWQMLFQLKLNKRFLFSNRSQFYIRKYPTKTTIYEALLFGAKLR